jgi:hypothetical protein
MIKIRSEWFDSGKVHKQTQTRLGFFRGVLDFGKTTRFTLKKFNNGEEAEMYALEVGMRLKGMTTPARTPTPALPLKGEGV